MTSEISQVTDRLTNRQTDGHHHRLNPRFASTGLTIHLSKFADSFVSYGAFLFIMKSYTEYTQENK